MNVGDYVRTKNGIIDEIVISYNGKCASPNCNKKHVSCRKNYYNEDEIVKSSLNIIDLIEVGDIITFKEDDDVYKVICIPDKKVGLDIFYLAKNYDGETEDISISKEQMEKYIKSIVTKEQFEAIKYEIK